MEQMIAVSGQYMQTAVHCDDLEMTLYQFNRLEILIRETNLILLVLQEIIFVEQG